MNESDLFLGIDLGTSGCRVSVVDRDSREQAFSQVPLPPSEGHDGHREQDPGQWWDAVTLAVRQATADLTAGTVRTLAVDGTSATLLLTDARGVPLTPALMYNDSRSRREAERIGQVAPPESGAHGASASLAKLLHLGDTVPHQAVHHALHQADWIVGRLTGHFGLSDENNSLKLGYDPIERVWPDWLTRLDVPKDWLPKVVPPGTPLAPLSAEAARTLGLAADTWVVAGTTDSIAGFLATGAQAPGDAVTSLGSTLVLKVVSEKPVFEPSLGVYSHRLGDLWLAGGASNSGGAVLLKYFSTAELAALTPLLRPDEPTGLDYYPLCAVGERFPVNDPDLPPRLTPCPHDNVRFLQAMLEGMARIERDGYRLLNRLGAPYPGSVRSVGGGARNPAWTAIRKRLLDAAMPPVEHGEAAYGTALLAHRGYQNLQQRNQV